ncbi:MAG: D-aminoacyl-tRNA deacylase [Oscillospiraceae bacterium]|nr:D-aminoacyl-tRNA deacylase [Oscillospiraceae bacterium]
MRAVIQRVGRASVEIDGAEYSSIGQGFLVLLGVCNGDTAQEADRVSHKIANMRIFNDAGKKMNLSLGDTGGQVLIISQFTLQADCRKGHRPSFAAAARPEAAIPLYERVCENLAAALGGGRVKTGVFGAEMRVSLINDGPVTIILDSDDL